MNVTVAYGSGEISVAIPDNVTVDTFEPGRTDKPVDEPSFLKQAQRGGLSEAFAAESPLIVVNDAHRRTPTELILGWLDAGYPKMLARARFLVACGTHPLPGEDELGRIFGRYVDLVRPSLVLHDCRDSSGLFLNGVDHFGEKVYTNKLIHKAEEVITINSVEPHYFAGYTGGRKSILPGLADRATIERNHNLANSLAAAPLKIDGNPVAEHMAEVARMAGSERIHTIQAVLDADGRMHSVFIGKLDDAFAAAVASARELCAYPVSQPYDVIISELHAPFDASLYQVQKAAENTQEAVADGGAAVLISECHKGIGNREFYDLADHWNAETNSHKDGATVFGSHKLSRVLGMQKRIDVCLHSSLSDSDVRRVFYEPVDDIDALIKTKINGKPGLRRVAVVHDASNTVLTLSHV